MRWGLTLSKLLPDGCSSFGTAFFASTWRQNFETQRLAARIFSVLEALVTACTAPKPALVAFKQIIETSGALTEPYDARQVLGVP